MEYQFEFGKKQLIVLASGLLFSSLLIFVAGVLVGVSLGTPAGAHALKEAAQLAAEQGEKAAAKAAAKLAQKGPKELAVVAKQMQSSDQPDPASVSPPPRPLTTAPTAPSVQPPAAPAASPAAPSAPSIPPALAALPMPEDRPLEKDVYSIQLGVFPEAKAARELQSDLRERGYRAEIFTAVDPEQRTWHAVRIGGFPTLESASAAAGGFTSRERIQALVRRSNAL